MSSIKSNMRRYSWVILYVCVLAATILYSLQSGAEKVVGLESEKVTITFRHLWTREHDRPIRDIFQDVVNQYQETHPHVKVNFEGLDQTIHREQKLKSEMVTGTPPDMFVLFGGAELEPYARAGRLMDLTEIAVEMEPAFRDLQLWTFNDRVYGLPFEGHAEPLYYNRMIFDRLGLQEPQTLDELYEIVRVLRDSGYTPFALGNEDLWPGAIYAHYLMDRYAGPELIEQLAYEGGASFVNDSYKMAFAKLRQLSMDRAFNVDASHASTEEAISMFTEGKAAMYLNGNWDITMFRGADGSREFEQRVGVMSFPTLRTGQSGSITGGYTIGIALSSNLTEEQKEAAIGLLREIYTEDVQSRIVTEGQRLPSMVIPIDPEETGPVFAQVYELMEKAESTFIAYDNVLSPEVNRTFLSVVDHVLNLRMTPYEALQELEEASIAYWKLRESR